MMEAHALQKDMRRISTHDFKNTSTYQQIHLIMIEKLLSIVINKSLTTVERTHIQN